MVAHLKEDIPGVTQAVDEWFSAKALDLNVAEGHIWWCKKLPFVS